MQFVSKFVKKFRKDFPKRVSFINIKRKLIIRKVYVFVKDHPFKTLFLILFIFLLLMILGNLIFTPKPESTNIEQVVKKIQIYKLGSAPLNTYQGKVDKSGVIKIVAQQGGIVQNINVFEGQNVNKGDNILSLSTNYSGGNTASVARQISQTQYNTAQDTYSIQKDIIADQRKLVDNNRSNGDLLKQVISQSTIDTQALLDLQNQIVNGISANIQNLEATNIGGVNDASILQAKELLSQYEAAMTQTRSSFGNLQVQSNQASGENTPLQYQIAQKQLDLQEKNLGMNLEIARLQYNMALVNEATMYPSAPFAGVIDRIYVHVGENVSQGTVLAQLSGTSESVEIVVSVPSDIARNISRFEQSILYIDGQTINMLPTYVSKNATNGVLYSVIYDLDKNQVDLTKDAYIKVQIPIGIADTTNIDPFVPIDAVLQTQEEAFVYVMDNKNIARARKVHLGQIQGRYVEILSGLLQNDSVILDRNVIDGDKVEAVN